MFRGMRRLLVPALLLCLATACAAAPEGGADGGVDAGPQGPTAWDPTLPDAAELPPVRGRHVVRGTVHLHSPYSHDACDGEGYRPDGTIDEVCLATLRAAACATRQDYLMLTDHPAFMAAQPFEDLLLAREGDAPAGDAAVWWACPDGRQVLVQVGYEDALMPLAMGAHLPGTAEARLAAYNEDTPERVASLREVGAFVAIAHIEGRTVAHLRELAPDAVEVYNLHANIDPDIRRDDLGLDAGGGIAALTPFLFTPEKAPLPDLAILGFLEVMPQNLERWYALLLDRPTLGIAALDAHQNVLPDPLADGERGDSYRRMMRWFSNEVLVDGPLTVASLREALEAGRAYAAFEVLCTPEGVDLRAERDGEVAGIGARLSASDGARLVAPVPRCHGGWAQAGPAPVPTMRLTRISGAPGGEPAVEVVYEGPGPVDLPAPGPGAYQLTVEVEPTHLLDWLGEDPEPYLRPMPWVITNPVYLP